MKFAKKFAVSKQWRVLLTDLGIEPCDALRLSKLPADLFELETAEITAPEYFRLWQSVDELTGEYELPLLLGQSLSGEAFDAPIFACLCSDNLLQALQRLKEYKPLIGPLLMAIDTTDKGVRITLECYGNDSPIPSALGVGELVFITQLARLGTRKKIQPDQLSAPQLPNNIELYKDYFDAELEQSEVLSISFSQEALNTPFVTANKGMWSFFEGSLKQRLSDLDSEATTHDRVKAILLESLPSGVSNAEDVSAKLAMSKRTLQRKLQNDGVDFQSVLQEVRQQLADHYLTKSSLSLSEISFLLGFQEANSFHRAYSAWRGVSPGKMRERSHLN